MAKNNNTIYKRHLAHALATTLEAKCNDRSQSCDHSGDGPDGGDPSAPHLSSVLAEESSFLHDCSTFMGYLVAVCILLKKAFTHKTGDRLVIVGWKFPSSKEDTSGNAASDS